MFTYEVQFCDLVQDQWQTENVRPAQWAGAHSKTNATCYESAFAEKTHMSFKPGEMAEQGHQKRNNGETASRIESGNAQATRKRKKNGEMGDWLRARLGRFFSLRLFAAKARLQGFLLSQC